MNILVITATYPPSTNGVAVSTKRLVTALRLLGHRVVVVGPSHPGVHDNDYLALPTARIPLLGLSDYPLPLPPPARIFWRRLPAIQWDIIHVHHPFLMGTFALALRRHLDAPVVFTYHTQYDKYLDHLTFLPRRLRHFLYTSAVLKLCQKFDRVIATTRWLQKELEKVLGHGKVVYATTAGIAKPFLVSQTKKNLRGALKLPPSEPILLSVSRLSWEKRTDILLRGFLRWAEHHTKGRLLVIGDGGYRRALEKLAKAHRQGHRVLFMGKIPNENLPPWYSSADLFLYSAITDTVGINIIEAMSAGLPVVAPDHKTTRELIRSGYNGILCSTASDSMAQAIDEVLMNEKRLSYGAINTVREYLLERTVQRILTIYEEARQEFRSSK